MDAFEQWYGDVLNEEEAGFSRSAWDAALEHAAKICKMVGDDWEDVGNFPAKDTASYMEHLIKREIKCAQKT